MRGLFRFALPALLALSAAGQASPVLMISLDGLRPADIIEAEARGIAAPRLRALMREGAYADGVVGVLPSLTYPSHVTLLTGVAPAVHGIANNLSFDPLNHNQMGWTWYSQDIKVPTLWQAAHRAGLRTANVHWPVSVGAEGVDYNLPQIWRTGEPDDRKLLAALATPGLLPPLEAALGAYPLGIDESVDGDAARVRFAARLLAERKPDFMTVYLAGIDHVEHHDGPDSAAAKAAIARTDGLVGALIDAARAARPDTTIVIVSDHGFAPVTTDVNLFAPFIAAGLIQIGADGKPTDWLAEPWIAGGTAAIRLKHPDDAALVARVRALLETMRATPALGIDRVLDAAEIRAAGGPAEASFLIALKPGYETGTDPAAPPARPSVLRGMHGYSPDLPAMRATLIVAGPGVHRHGALGLVDMRAIAPSVARILGAPMPDAKIAPAF
ncbi:alkaline phosphatase family protein [Sphingomonas morindae]|uniref:Alkaline phosphatase family protein n=1 Tax=Sphingomonas morindae TaxID=1541170 RepID=A0ABY4XAS0_9SPHN|nr:ectonucleotide pyrophosphatase/phosphodiesterase [Sphingomonas morindae]USI73980.1 alkaline phosphatase family protein [Sphingomonas morindae]